jgi:hypothetical protein
MERKISNSMGKPGFLGGAGFFWGRLRAEGDFANRGRGSANRKLILQIEMLFLQTGYQSANRWIGPANRKLILQIERLICK